MMTAPALTPGRATGPNAASDSSLRAEEAIPPGDFGILRRRALLEGCKWDPQVGDTATLAPFPLVMKSAAWARICGQAENLAAEAAAAEEEISRRPELLRVLALPRVLRSVLADRVPLTPAAGRVIRFDFHYTTEGWRISEANSDVPGGFSEASHFTELVAAHYPALRPAGNPGDVWAEALAESAGPDGLVGLLSAPGWMEDHQVMAYLAARLGARGCRTYRTKPEQLLWRDGAAYLQTAYGVETLNAIVRFYQAEWAAHLPERSGWQFLFRGGRTPVANPALAVLSESKRFPLAWDRLSTAIPTWRALLPETRDPRAVRWADGDWLLKTAFCNTGDAVCIRELMSRREWLATRWAVRLSPGKWLAQRRFRSVPVETPAGLRHVCIGIYTINGKAAGAYARLSEGPLISFLAVDAALLLEDDE